MLRRHTTAIGPVAGLLLLLQVGLVTADDEPRYRTTHPVIALRNLDYQIEQARRVLRARPNDVDVFAVSSTIG